MAEQPVLTMAEKMQHVEAKIASGESARAYGTRVGIPPSSIGYWVKLHRERNEKTTGKVKRSEKQSDEPTSKAVTSGELAQLRAENSALLFQRDDLTRQVEELSRKLENATDRFRALYAIIEMAGHQMVDD